MLEIDDGYGIGPYCVEVDCDGEGVEWMLGLFDGGGIGVVDRWFDGAIDGLGD